MPKISALPAIASGKLTGATLFAGVGSDSITARLTAAQMGTPLTPEQFYAVGDGTTDDSAAFQAMFNALSSVAPGYGGRILLAPKHYRCCNIVPPTGVSFVVQGSGQTATILSPPAATPSNPIFDLTGSNGPAKCFRDLELAGANFGLFESTGILCHTTNGLILDHVWMAGLLIGVDWTSPSTFLNSTSCVMESCGIAFNFRVAPTEVSIVNPTYYSNAQDVQVVGDCSTFTHVGGNSISCTNTSILASSATDFSLSDFKISAAVSAINLTNSDNASFRGVQLTACGTDFTTSGTVRRVFLLDVKGNAASLISGAVFIGYRTATGQRVFWGTTTPVAGAWLLGDRVMNTVPAVSSPKSWVCTVAGTPGTWVSEGNL